MTILVRFIVERPRTWRLALIVLTLLLAACQPGEGGGGDPGGGDPGGGAQPGGDGY